MDFKNFSIAKYKNKILNLAILGASLLIAMNIYKRQAGVIAALEERKNITLRKSEVLLDIDKLENKFISYKSAINIKDTSSMINRLSNIARGASLNIISLKPQPEEPYPGYTKYPFKLTIEAPDYHSLGKFIAGIENSPDIYTIENISISKSKGKELVNKTPLNAELKLSTILVK